MLTLTGRVLPPPGARLDLDGLLFMGTTLGWAGVGFALFWRGARKGSVTPVLVGQTVSEALTPSLLGLALGQPWSDGSPTLTAAAFALALLCAVWIAAPETEPAEVARHSVSSRGGLRLTRTSTRYGR